MNNPQIGSVLAGGFAAAFLVSASLSTCHKIKLDEVTWSNSVLKIQLAQAQEINSTVARLHEHPFWYGYQPGYVSSEPMGKGDVVTFEPEGPIDPWESTTRVNGQKKKLVPRSMGPDFHTPGIFGGLWQWKQEDK